MTTDQIPTSEELEALRQAWNASSWLNVKNLNAYAAAKAQSDHDAEIEALRNAADSTLKEYENAVYNADNARMLELEAEERHETALAAFMEATR
jgi:hypothetical protein